MVSFPVEVLLGRLGPSDIVIGYVAQAGWIGASLLVLRLAWRAGTRKYSAVGA
jgi:ABC-2 type transport system permease protein